MTKFLTIFTALFLLCSCNKSEVALSPLTIETENGNITYNIETASSVAELERGLMERESLAADSGMIFDLSPYQDKPTAMWMKDTKIALDMLFINKDGEIFFIKENAVPMSEELIEAPEPAKAVLELNAGEVKKHQIKVGHRVFHGLFGNEISQNQSEEKK